MNMLNEPLVLNAQRKSGGIVDSTSYARQKHPVSGTVEKMVERFSVLYGQTNDIMTRFTNYTYNDYDEEYLGEKHIGVLIPILRDIYYIVNHLGDQCLLAIISLSDIFDMFVFDYASLKKLFPRDLSPDIRDEYARSRPGARFSFSTSELSRPFQSSQSSALFGLQSDN